MELIEQSPSEVPAEATSVLLGPQTKKLMRGVCRLAAVLKCSPLDWNSSTSSVVLCTKPSRYIGWYTNVGVTLAYQLFLVIRLIQSETGYIKTTNAEAAIIKFWIGTYMFQVVCQVALVLNGLEIPGMLWRAANWFQRVEDYYRETPNAAAQALLTPEMDKYLFSMFYADVLWPFLWPIPCMLYPGQWIYPTSLMEDPEDLMLLLLYRGVGAALYAYIIVMWYCSVWIWFTSFVPVTINLPLVLQALTAHLQDLEKSEPPTAATTRERQVTLRFYREAQILAAEFSDVCCSVFIPGMKWTITVGITYCMCGALSLSDWPPRALLVAFFLVVVPTMEIVFTYLGQFWTQSNNFLKTGRGCLKDDVDRRSLRSLAPIKAVMGGMYFIDELSALIMLNFTITTSIGIIVTSKSS